MLDDSTLDEMQGNDSQERERELARKLLLKCGNSLIPSLSSKQHILKFIYVL